MKSENLMHVKTDDGDFSIPFAAITAINTLTSPDGLSGSPITVHLFGGGRVVVGFSLTEPAPDPRYPEANLVRVVKSKQFLFDEMKDAWETWLSREGN